MNENILKSKSVVVTMLLDGKEFKQTVTIPEGTAENQYIRCKSIGDCLANTIMYNTDIKEQIKQQVTA